MSEANVKANGMVTTKWTYHKERSFAKNYFIFLKILFRFKNLLQRVDLMYQRPKCPHPYFYKRWSFICFIWVSWEEHINWLKEFTVFKFLIRCMEKLVQKTIFILHFTVWKTVTHIHILFRKMSDSYLKIIVIVIC